MKKMWIPITILLGFLYVLGNYLLTTGRMGNWFWILLFGYILWILVAGFPALIAFAFQSFVCNTTQNLFLRLIPTASVLALLFLESRQPLYGLANNLLCYFMYIPNWLIIPVILAGLLAGWVVKLERSDASC